VVSTVFTSHWIPSINVFHPLSVTLVSGWIAGSAIARSKLNSYGVRAVRLAAASAACRASASLA